MKDYKKPLLILGVLALIIGVVTVPMLLKKEKGTKIQYKKYLTENRALNNTINGYDEKLKLSFAEYQSGKMTADQYFNKVEEIRKDKDKVKAEQLNLKKEYKLDGDLKDVVFSDNKETDAKLKDLFLKNQALEEEDEKLDKEEEALEKSFEDGAISEAEFETKKAAIEAREEALELQEEELDAQEDLLDIDDEDDNETEDDEQDDDKDTD